MRLLPALALVSSVLPAAAEAAVVSYSAPASGAEPAVLNTIADFDPSFGTLQRVRLRLSGTVSDHVTGAVRSRYDQDEGGYGKPSRISFASATGVPYVSLGSIGGELWGDAVEVTFMVVSGEFSGGHSTPFEASVDLPVEIFGKRVALPPEFFGSDSDGNKTYALGAGTALGLPFPTWTWDSRPSFQGGATITYDYSPVGVPEPAPLAVVGLGLTGCLAARWRAADPAMSRRRRIRLADFPASDPCA